ncbi:MAG TPA: hypothetical protein DD979_13405 [Gammaproteobacteria bacterium]|nr:hypothetical protein [Gammaproteobacteria bacterium]
MLSNLRESIKQSKVIKFVLLVFICAPFALFGINSYFGGGGSAYAVKVNGNKVPVNVFDREYNAQRNRLRQAFGGKIPEGFASEDLLKQQALESLITGEVLNDVVQGHNIVVSDQSLAKAIVATEVFQVDGRFDKERYTVQLRSSGFTEESFENQFRHDVAVQGFRDAIVRSNFVLNNETAVAERLSRQIRNATVLTFKLDPILEKMQIEDADVTAFFDENSANYTHPERVKIEYIELKSDTLKDQIEVSEEDARAYFEGNAQNYRVPEERSASHILVSLDEGAGDEEADAALQKITQAKARIDAGETFEDVAKDVSEDPGSAEAGGSLGYFGRGAMVPAFEESAFSLAQGELSEPVRSSFGYHLIRVDEIREERGKAFEDVQSEIIDVLQQQRADEAFFDQSELLANASYENPDSLVPAAETGAFDIQVSDWIDRLTKEGIAANPAVINAALSQEVLQAGNNSEPIELGSNHVVVLRVQEHEGPRPKSLDEVREVISDELKRKAATELLEANVDSAQTRILAGDALTEVAGSYEAEVAEARDLTRSTTEVASNVITALFAMPRPTDDAPRLTTVTNPSGDHEIIVLHSVTDGAEDAESEGGQPSIDATQIGNAEYAAALRALRSKALVEINQQVLQPHTGM